MLRYHTVKMYPTDEQRQKIITNIHHVRYIYNWGLEQRILDYSLKSDKKSTKKKSEEKTKSNYLSSYEVINMIKPLKEEKEFLKESDSWSLQNAIGNLDQAYTRFFRGQNRFPRFKKRPLIGGSYKPAAHRTEIINQEIKLPKIGLVKIKGLRYQKGATFKSATVIWNPDDTITCSLLYELPDLEPMEIKETIGIDLGATVWITESNGNQIHQVDLSKVYTQLKNEEQKRDKKQKSKNRLKAQIKMNKHHRKIHNKKKDQIRKVANDYNQLGIQVIHENLKTSELYQERKKNLNKLLQDQNWSMFLDTLKNKTETIEIEKAYTSQECHRCHYTNKLNRKNQATFRCLKCQNEMNADHNAAINILNRGTLGVSLSLTELTGVVCKHNNLNSIY